MRRHRPGVLAMIKARVKSGRCGKQTLAWINILMQDPCPYCGLAGCDTVDHITPVIKRDQLNTGFGKDHWTNLTACHKRCNLQKGSNGVIHV